MTFLALTLLVEIAAAIALLRMKRTQRGHVMNCAAFLISLASACSIAIAVQGCVMYNASMIERWQLWLGLMWLIAGLFGFAISISMRPIRASITSPCWMVATVAVAYALLYRDMMSAAVGGVIMAFTIGISCRLSLSFLRAESSEQTDSLERGSTAETAD